MKQRLLLAVICVFFPVLSGIVLQLSGGYLLLYNQIGSHGMSYYSFFSWLWPFGTLPIFISVYRKLQSGDLINTPEEELNDNWVPYALKRFALVIASIGIAVLTGTLTGGLGGAYVIVYVGIALFLAVSVYLLIDGIMLFRKKLYAKLYINFFLISGLLSAIYSAL